MEDSAYAAAAAIADPMHTHTLADPGHSHTLADPGHQHTYSEAHPYAQGELSRRTPDLNGQLEYIRQERDTLRQLLNDALKDTSSWKLTAETLAKNVVPEDEVAAMASLHQEVETLSRDRFQAECEAANLRSVMARVVQERDHWYGKAMARNPPKPENMYTQTEFDAMRDAMDDALSNVVKERDTALAQLRNLDLTCGTGGFQPTGAGKVSSTGEGEEVKNTVEKIVDQLTTGRVPRPDVDRIGDAVSKAKRDGAVGRIVRFG